MRILLSIAFIAILLLGCDSLEMPEPLPHASQPIDREQFEGTWHVEDASLVARFTDDGVLHFASVEWEEDAFKMIEGHAHITRGERASYLSIHIENEEEEDQKYALVRYKMTDRGELIIWAPVVETFASAIENGGLKGDVRRGEHSMDVKLSSPPDEILQYLENPEHENLFDLESPGVYRKLPASD